METTDIEFYHILTIHIELSREFFFFWGGGGGGPDVHHGTGTQQWTSTYSSFLVSLILQMVSDVCENKQGDIRNWLKCCQNNVRITCGR